MNTSDTKHPDSYFPPIEKLVSDEMVRRRIKKLEADKKAITNAKTIKEIQDALIHTSWWLLPEAKLKAIKNLLSTETTYVFAKRRRAQ